jgi:MFS family permease
MDPVGQLLVLTALASLTYAVIEGPSYGWSSARIEALFATAAGAVIALLVYEPRRAEPLLDLRFFRSVPFSAATVIAVCAFATFSGFLFLNALYLQDVRHMPAFETGLYTLPLAVTTSLCAPISGRLVGRHGTKLPLVIAGVALATCALGMVRLDAETSLAWVVAMYVVFGIGFGMVNAPITNTAVSGMPRARAGLAAAIASTSRQVGASLGVAISGTIVASHGRGGGRFVDAMHVFFWVAAAAGTAIVLLGLASNSAWGRRTERTAAALIDDPQGAPA